MTASDTILVAGTGPTFQGETSRAGFSCWLIRLAGCPLHCRFCDTAWARTGGESVDIETLCDVARRSRLHHVLVTGGEPLHQSATPALLRGLCDAELLVALETSGAFPTDDVDERARIVLDVKCPGSGMEKRMHWPNLDRLRPHDEVKLVLTDRSDYRYAREVIERYSLVDRVEVVLSPAEGRLAPQTLARWILSDRLPVRLGLQLHKLAWPDLG